MAPARVLTMFVLMITSVVVSPTAGAQVQTADRPDANVVRRVVWDATVRGGVKIDIRSALVDGTDVRRLFTRDRGFVLELALNPRGTKVVFAPFTERKRAELLVVDVRGGEVRDVLADTPRFEVIGGVGWSPNGQRLVFQGTVYVDGEGVTHLWTVRSDGSELRRGVLIPPDDPWNPSLAWTRRGVVYSGPGGLLVWRGGQHIEQLVSGGSNARVSGNGRWLYFTRRYDNGRTDFVRCRPSGRTRTLVLRGIQPDRGPRYFVPQVFPDYSGRHALAVASLRGPARPTSRTFVLESGRRGTPDGYLPWRDGLGSVLTWN